MASSLPKSKQIIGVHFQTLFSTIFVLLTFLNSQMDLILLKTYDQQLSLTTQKSLHIIFKPEVGLPLDSCRALPTTVQLDDRGTHVSRVNDLPVDVTW